MGRKYLPVNRDQPMMLPEDMRRWVEQDHLVWFLAEVMDGLDTSALESLGRPGKGRPGYHPRMLAVLVIYAYCQGVRASRKIEQRGRTDAAFRVATGNAVPDHSTICRFRAAAAAAGGPLEDLFTGGLFVLAAAGLGRLDVISVDGSKIWADASRQANRTEEGLRKLARKILDEAARADGEGCTCDGHEHGQAAGLGAPQSCGCCDGGTLPGLGLDGPAVPRAGWGGAPRGARIAAGLADLEAARLAHEAARRGIAGAYPDAAPAGGAPPGRARGRPAPAGPGKARPSARPASGSPPPAPARPREKNTNQAARRSRSRCGTSPTPTPGSCTAPCAAPCRPITARSRAPATACSCCPAPPPTPTTPPRSPRHCKPSPSRSRSSPPGTPPRAARPSGHASARSR